MSNIIKLADTPQGQSRALGKHFENTNECITNGAIAHYGDIVRADYLSGICGHIEWTASTLKHEATNAAAYALMALEAGRSVEEKDKLLRMIREGLLRGLDRYNDALEIKRLDHEGE